MGRQRGRFASHRPRRRHDLRRDDGLERERHRGPEARLRGSGGVARSPAARDDRPNRCRLEDAARDHRLR
jgi:hypothetical protein